MRRKPDWLKVPLPNTREFTRVRSLLESLNLHSVCHEARCPNKGECFQSGTATFLILGSTCTRNCRYCHVGHGEPAPVDPEEPDRLVRAVKELGLTYVVITSVTRDDLEDGGASIFSRTTALLKKEVPGCRVELLVPDFGGDWQALDGVLAASPDVLNHNMEVVPRLFATLRPEGNYRRSLELLRRSAQSGAVTKSGFMIGLGEQRLEILGLLDDLAAVSCGRLTIGQYLQPASHLWPVQTYYDPGFFDEMKREALKKGFGSVLSGPLVRSSYHAAMQG